MFLSVSLSLFWTHRYFCGNISLFDTILTHFCDCWCSTQKLMKLLVFVFTDFSPVQVRPGQVIEIFGMDEAESEKSRQIRLMAAFWPKKKIHCSPSGSLEILPAKTGATEKCRQGIHGTVDWNFEIFHPFPAVECKDSIGLSWSWLCVQNLTHKSGRTIVDSEHFTYKPSLRAHEALHVQPTSR